jgi:hypothetical protein
MTAQTVDQKLDDMAAAARLEMANSNRPNVIMREYFSRCVWLGRQVAQEDYLNAPTTNIHPPDVEAL